MSEGSGPSNHGAHNRRATATGHKSSNVASETALLTEAQIEWINNDLVTREPGVALDLIINTYEKDSPERLALEHSRNHRKAYLKLRSKPRGDVSSHVKQLDDAIKQAKIQKAHKVQVALTIAKLVHQGYVARGYRAYTARRKQDLQPEAPTSKGDQQELLKARQERDDMLSRQETIRSRIFKRMDRLQALNDGAGTAKEELRGLLEKLRGMPAMDRSSRPIVDDDGNPIFRGKVIDWTMAGQGPHHSDAQAQATSSASRAGSVRHQSRSPTPRNNYELGFTNINGTWYVGNEENGT